MRVEPRLPRTRPHDLPSKLILRFIFWELLSPCYFFYLLILNASLLDS